MLQQVPPLVLSGGRPGTPKGGTTASCIGVQPLTFSGQKLALPLVEQCSTLVSYVPEVPLHRGVGGEGGEGCLAA